MDRIKRVRNSLNLPAQGKLAAAVVGIIGVGVPAYLLRGTDWSKVEFSVLGVLPPLLYIVAVVALMVAAAGTTGPNVASKDTDEKVVSMLSRIQERLTPLYRVAAILLLGWVLHLLWSLRHSF
jgi:hypothetical protein